MTVLIKFTDIGTDAGPFNLFSDVDVPAFSIAFEQNIPRQQLLDGFQSSKVPVGTSFVRVSSVGTCNNFVFLLMPGVTTSTSSTSSSSTTTSTTTVPTTTTTSTTVTYQYTDDGYFCSTCGISGTGGTIRNHTPLTVGKYYFSPTASPPQMFKITSFVGIITTPPVTFLLDADGTFTCPNPACPTTTTTTTL